MSKKKKTGNNLTFTIILATTVLLVVFGVTVATIGYYRFNDMLLDLYHEQSFTTASSTLHFINADHIESYLEYADKITGKEEIGEDEQNVAALKEEFAKIDQRLQKFAKTQEVAILYMIVPDSTDYANYYSIFNCPNSKYVPYSAWELGSIHSHAKDSEYNEIYRRLMEGELESAVVNNTKTTNGALPHMNLMLAVKDSDGKIVAIIVVQQTMEMLNKWVGAYLLLIAVTTLVLISISVFGYITYMRKQVVSPIQAVVAEAERFAKDNSAPEVPLSEKISRINEITDLANSITKMELDTLKNIENLSTIIKEKQKISSELGIAKQIQEAFLPKTFPAFPDRKEFDLYAAMRPALQVGGDFYDYFLVDEDHLVFEIADVSGKGIPAALFMMVTKILINEVSMSLRSPADILRIVNKRICRHNEAEMFVTVWLGILEISTGKIIAANAGHDSPCVTRNGRFEFIKAKRGLVLGAMDNAVYTDFEFQLEKGDKLFLFTDGVPEATDANEKMFTLDAMLGAVNELKDKDPKGIIEGIYEKLDEFAGDAPQFDDTTMVCIELMGDQDMNTIQMDIPVDMENLTILNDRLEEFLEEKGADRKTITRMIIATEEIFVNIVHYSGLSASENMSVSMRFEDGRFFITFKDGGIPYDPLSRSDPDITLSVNERKEGGLGIFMTKNIVDDIHYEYADGHNILTLEKQL